MLNHLRDQLADLKRKEVIAQTREQLLVEERQKLLMEVAEFYEQVQKLNLISKEELTPNNLSVVVDKLQSYINSEITKVDIPQELQ